jgi:hypothetical protein
MTTKNMIMRLQTYSLMKVPAVYDGRLKNGRTKWYFGLEDRGI